MSTIHGCRDCYFRSGKLFNNKNDPKTRINCKKRHAHVDVDQMSKYCEFYQIDPYFKDINLQHNPDLTV